MSKSGSAEVSEYSERIACANSFKRLILRTAPRQVKSMVIRVVPMFNQVELPEFRKVFLGNRRPRRGASLALLKELKVIVSCKRWSVSGQFQVCNYLTINV